MTTLTAEQREYLDNYQIPLGAVFDASGLAKSEYSKIMKDLEKSVAIGVTPCKKEGHSMRTRAGHCMQCNRASHTFLLRHEANAKVYITASESGKFLKIGTTSDAEKRVSSLNSFGYAGVTDWELICSYKTSNAGLIEHKTQKDVSNFACPTQYEKDGRTIDCLETFRCKYSRAKTALLRNLANEDHQEMNCNAELEAFFDTLDEETGNFVRKGNIEGIRASGIQPMSRKVLQKSDDKTHSTEKSSVDNSNQKGKTDIIYSKSSYYGPVSVLTIIILLLAVFYFLV